ncbi:hypothetical protein Tco_0774584 [Tanacetum coccineum]|uniref:Uncharacterized protein n=1 Tax=Tanacetum coccineum TaxID=301880 RepID=A0ABQ4ZNX2_9ASTR
MLKMVSETPLQFGVAERLSQTFRAESTGIRAEAPKMLWADSVNTTYLIYRIPYVSIGLHIPEEEWRGNDTSLTHLKVFGCDSFVKVKDVCGEAMKCTFIGSGSDEMRYSFWDTKSHQSLGGSSDTSEGSENSGSFDYSRRSDEEYSKDGASSKEGGSETPQVDDMLVAGSDMAEFNKPKWQLPLVFEMNDIYSEKQVLRYVLTVGVTTVEWESRLHKSIIIWAKLVRILISEGSLSLLKILGMKCLAEMFTRLVMKEKLKFYAALTGLRVN